MWKAKSAKVARGSLGEKRKEGVAVVCERACCESHTGMNMAEEEVDLSGERVSINVS